VAGIGPIGSGRRAATPRNPEPPILGMFWNLVVVAIPDTADGFLARTHPTAMAAVTAAGLDIREFEGRVAIDVACFDQRSFPSGCEWLDSQSQIEVSLETDDLIPTNVNVNSTFVSFDKTSVHR
jgi:hypothetical protein